MRHITAVIPTYNRAALLGRAIDSVLNQRCLPSQIVVVDNDSTDDTRDVCQRYATQVEYVWQENGGASSSRNRGIALARSPWVAFLDSDDYWVEAHLERMNAAITDTSEHADLYFADMQMPSTEGGGTLWERIGFRPPAPYHLVPDATPWALMKRQPMMLQSSVIRRSALARLGGLDMRFRLIHDSYLFCQLGIGSPACAVSGVGCVQTADDESQVRITTAIPLDSLEKLRESSVMWDLVNRSKSIPDEFRRLVRYNAAASSWGLGVADVRARKYARGLARCLRAIALDPHFGQWLLVNRSARGYERTVRPACSEMS